MKICPDCAEMVNADAKVCKFCGHQFLSKAERATKAFEVAFVVIVVGVAFAWWSISQARGR